MHFRQPGFGYSASGPFTKNKRRQKFKETEDSRYIYQNELHQACFQDDMVNGDFKDQPRRTASDKVLRDKAFDIAKNPKYDGCKQRLALMAYKCFDKMFSGSGVKSEVMPNQQLAEELHKQTTG